MSTPTIAQARKVALLDLQAQLAPIRSEIMSAIERVVDSQKFILGEDVQKLEAQVADYSSCKFAIGCASRDGLGGGSGFPPMSRALTLPTSRSRSPR